MTTSNEPPWDLIDLDAAKRAVTANGPTTAIAHRTGSGCAVSVTRDARSGWYVVVAVGDRADVPTVVELLPPDETRARLAGSIAPEEDSGPRLHYAVARNPDPTELRIQSGGGPWNSGSLNSETGWSAVCLRTEVFSEAVSVEMKSEAGTWESISA